VSPAASDELDFDSSRRWAVSSGLIALLDDISALVKVAAASLDDAGAQAAKAGGKAAGIVED
jgi:predicted DNA repair protein MutK